MYSKQEQKYRLSLPLSPESENQLEEFSWRNLAELLGNAAYVQCSLSSTPLPRVGVAYW